MPPLEVVEISTLLKTVSHCGHFYAGIGWGCFNLILEIHLGFGEGGGDL